jgi:glycosyltransferase involved in cell wall biosynthesis
MRILHVSPFFSPSMGGIAHVVNQMAFHLARRGHRVTVLAGDHNARISRFPAVGFEQVLLPCVSSRWGFYLTPSLGSWIRDHLAEYDILHLHAFRTHQNIIVHRQAGRRGIPFVVSAHGTMPVIFKHQLAKRGFDLLFGNALRISSRAWIAVSSMEKDQYVRAGIPPEKIELVHNGLDLDLYRRLPRRGSFRKKCPGFDPTIQMILYLGRLDRTKGIHDLLRAFLLLQPKLPDSRLVVAGPDENGLESLVRSARRSGVQGKVLFPGPLYDTDKLEALVDADVLVSPAVHEIFGLTAFEALLCGTPVVVCRESGLGRMIAEIDAGSAVPAADAAAVEEAVYQILSRPEEAAPKVKRGQAFIRNKLDWKILVRELEGVYRKALMSSE